MLDGVAALRARLLADGLRRVGALGTRAVMDSGFYGMEGVEVLALEGDERGAVDADTSALALAGTATAGQRDRFIAAGARLRARGAEVVVLGGTDLSLAFDGAEPGYPVLDSALVHAEAITREMMAG